jgi:hypothetical protein
MAYKPQVIGNTKGLRPEVIEKLEEISKNTGKPVTVTPEGAFRKIKPGETSAHNYGLAADIKIPGYNTEQIADELRKVGFTGIGCYYDNDGTPRMFAHGDIRGHDAAKGTPFGRGTAHGGPAHWVRVYRDSSRKTWDDYKNKEEWQRKRGIKPSPPEEKAKPKVNVKMNLLAGLIAGLIAALVIVIVFWSQGFFGGGGGGGGGTWQIVSEGQTATLTVDSSGNFTGSGWVGTAPGASPPNYNIYITNGRMSGTSMTFNVSASYASGQGYISATCIDGQMNGSFPNANYASGAFSGTAKDPLETYPRDVNNSWTATRIS